jgi:hypothetical protein
MLVGLQHRMILFQFFFFGTGGESPCTDIYLSKKTGPSAKRFSFLIVI